MKAGWSFTVIFGVALGVAACVMLGIAPQNILWVAILYAGVMASLGFAFGNLDLAAKRGYGKDLRGCCFHLFGAVLFFALGIACMTMMFRMGGII